MQEATTAVESTPASARASARRARQGLPLYGLLWRWHFWTGILVVPFLLILAVTGGIYVFKDELDPFVHPGRFFVDVPPGAARVPASAALTAAIEATPGFEANQIIVFDDPARTYHVLLVEEHEHVPGESHPVVERRFAAVDPYSGAVVDQWNFREEFFYIVKMLHRRLLAGTPGRILVELATCWTIVLLFTGLYLWWPRGRPNRSVWLPKIRGTKAHAALRNVHAVIGAYSVPLAFILSFTGLFFAKVWSTAYLGIGLATGHLDPAMLEMTPSTVIENATPVSVDRAIEAITPLRSNDHSLEISLPDGPEGSYRIQEVDFENLSKISGYDVDQYSGEVLGLKRWDDLPAMFRGRILALSIHLGQIYGMWTKVLAFVSMILIIAVAVLGVWMWLHRRPAGKTGFPRGSLRKPVGRGVKLLMIVGGVLMPVAGISMLLILLGDRIVQRFRARPA
ncbi:MAG: PepSY domain-containing protein [Planctomycetota bacterium]